MKNLLFIPLAFVLAFTACGQKVKKEDLPSAVQAKFKALYPAITDVKWSKENAKYEAAFDLNKVETSVTIDSLGNLFETEIEISVSDLPTAIATYFTKNFPGEKIKEAAKITDPKGVVTYEAEMKDVDYLFDKDGVFIKKSEDKD